MPVTAQCSSDEACPAAAKDNVVTSSRARTAARGNTAVKPTADRRLSTTSFLLQNAKRPKSSAQTTIPGNKAKSSSILRFFTLKDPSTAAVQLAAREHKKQFTTSTSTARPSTANSTQRLPPNIPKVNSKWDGLPSSATANGSRSKSQLMFRQNSITSSSSKSVVSRTSSTRRRYSSRNETRPPPHSHSLQAIITGRTPATSEQSSPRASSVTDRQDSVTALSPIVPPASTEFAAPGPISRGLSRVNERATESHKSEALVESRPAVTTWEKISTSAARSNHGGSSADGHPISVPEGSETVLAQSQERLSVLGLDASHSQPIATSENSSLQSVSSWSSAAIKTAKASFDTPPSSGPVSPICDLDNVPGTGKFAFVAPDPARLSGPFGIASVDSRPVLDYPAIHFESTTESTSAMPPSGISRQVKANEAAPIVSASSGHVRSASQDHSPRNFSKPFASEASQSAGTGAVANVPRSRFAIVPSIGHIRNWSADSAVSKSRYALMSSDSKPEPSELRDATPRHEVIADLRRHRRLTAESQTLSMRPTVDGPMTSLPAW